MPFPLHVLSIAVLVLAQVLPAQAEPRAASKNFTECAIVFQVSGMLAERKQKPAQDLAHYNEGVRRFRETAVAQARLEGQPNPSEYVNGFYEELLPLWQKKYQAMTAKNGAADAEAIHETEDLMQRIAQCGKIGRDAGILPIEPAPSAQ